MMTIPALLPRQVRFVEEYLIDLNGKQAAIRAGYSSKTAEAIASRLLSKVNVQKAITVAVEARSVRTEINQDWVIAKLVENVERAMQSIPVLDRQGGETGKYTYEGQVANTALKLLGDHLR